MGWTETVFTPAVVSAVVATIVVLVNRSTTLKTHREKLASDFKLAETKLAADIALSQRKFELDKHLADWKRRTEIAEQVLSDFYKARDIFVDARQPFTRSDGAERPGRDDEETEDERSHRDAIYAPYARLVRERDFFSDMQARRFRFMALFGGSAGEPFMVFVQQFNLVARATGMLLRSPSMSEGLRQRYEDAIGWQVSERDELIERLDGAVRTIETICGPVLQANPTNNPSLDS